VWPHLEGASSCLVVVTLRWPLLRAWAHFSKALATLQGLLQQLLLLPDALVLSIDIHILQTRPSTVSHNGMGLPGEACDWQSFFFLRRWGCSVPDQSHIATTAGSGVQFGTALQPCEYHHAWLCIMRHH
jgi:hypothetical protein